MISPPSPSTEEQRLRAVADYEAIGLEAEESFDRVTSLAARIFHVPVALISLVGRTEQHFKSHHGVEVCETSREVAFCPYALTLAPTETLVVLDATLDPRFAGSSLVTGEMHVRFYAGAPLRTAAGHVIGTLCLLDTVARTGFSNEERRMLTDLAETVMEAFELRLTRERERREVAERRNAEVEARLAAQRVRTVLESITDAFIALDGQGRFTQLNEQAERMLGRSRAELMGHKFSEKFVTETPSIFVLNYRKALLTGDSVHFEAYSEVVKCWFDTHIYPTAEGVSVYFRDITGRREAQRRLEDSYALLRAIIDGTDDAVFLKDHESRYILINPAGAAFLGMPAEEIIGKDDTSFFSAGSARTTRERDLSVLETGRSFTYEACDVIGGVERCFSATKSPYRDAAGNLVGVIGIARDTSEQRHAAEALREAKEEAEQASRAKSEFLSRMSHELRTPLNAILGFSQLLELADHGERHAESVGHILRAGRHLLGLIDEVLAISRIETGHVNFSLEPVALGEIARECVSLVARMAADRGVHCEDHCESCEAAGPTVYVLADRQRLQQVLLNLLSNAIKYNREGGRVTVSCHAVPDLPPSSATRDIHGENHPDLAEGAVRIEVTDTGDGIARSDIARLFTPFERLRADETETEGTGLGLALSKGLVEAMGGRIGVESEIGAGCTFWFELPRARNPLERLNRGTPQTPSSALDLNCRGTVLYIEDNLSNLRLIECLLDRQPGLQLLSAQQGTLGLEVALARLPDLILLDLHLPDVPGWDILARLQEDPSTRVIPTIIISADATPKQIARLRSAGATDYLTKPLDVRDLLAVLREHLPSADSPADA